MPNIITVVGNPVVPLQGGLMIGVSLVVGVGNWFFQTPILKLYKNDPVIGPGMALADLEECDFTGYADVSMTGMVAVLDENDVPMCTREQSSFVGGSPLTLPGQVTGWYMVDVDETAVIAVQRFPTPFPVDEPGDTVQLTPRVYLPGWGPVP